MDTPKKVYVHRNLHKGGYSILDAKTYRVIDYQWEVFLENVEFRVRKYGQAMVRKQKQKNVHAFAVGFIVDKFTANDALRITYDPYAHNTFVEVESGEEVLQSFRCILNEKGCFIVKK
jgi:hypothetical protein